MQMYKVLIYYLLMRQVVFLINNIPDNVGVHIINMDTAVHEQIVLMMMEASLSSLTQDLTEKLRLLLTIMLCIIYLMMISINQM